VHLTAEQLATMDEVALEDYYGWARSKMKACASVGSYGLARAYDRVASQAWTELWRREFRACAEQRREQ
jgi:hypothetical protein